MIPQPIALYAAAALALLSFSAGYKVASWKQSASIAKQVAKSERAAQVETTRRETIASTFETERAKANEAYVSRVRRVYQVYSSQPVTAGCAVGPDAYGLLVNAVRDANLAASSEPLDAMRQDPAPATAAR